MLFICLLTTGVFGFYMNTTTRMFTDDYRRTIIFHGFNVVVKVPPYIPITDKFDPQMSLNSEDISNLVDWGFNFIRMGVMWESVERRPGWFNMTYLSEMDALIRTLGEKGIYTLVDAHQDVFARHICGEGVPNFYAEYLDDSCGVFAPLIEGVLCKPFSSYNMTLDSDGNPIIKDCLKNLFALYYMTPQAQDAFERLYKNTYGLQDRFAAFWKTVSGVFKDNPYVIGYDIINEPQSANLFKEPWLLLPGFFDRDVLQPLYSRMHYEIRQQDPNKIIFFEPTQSDLLPILGGIVLDTGFIETPGGVSFNDRQVLNDHAYCCQSDPTICASGEPPLDKAAQCRKFNFARVNTRAQNAKKLGVGLIMSEFGACFDTEACAAEIKGVADACDENLVGWGYWMFKGYQDFTTSGSYSEGLYDENGDLQTVKLKALSRTYILAYQGAPVSAQLDDADFTAVYMVDPSIDAPTILFANKELIYPNGFDLRITNSAGLIADVEEKGNYITIQFKSGEYSETKVELYPKSAS